MKTRLLMLAAGAALTGIFLLALALQKTVILLVDQQRYEVTTFAFTVGDVLHEAGIRLAAVDSISPAADQPLREGATLVVDRAALVTIWADGAAHTLRSRETLVANLLSQAGIRLFPGDQILWDQQPLAADDSLPESKSIALQVRRAIPITLILDDEPQTILSTAATLGQALWQAGIILRAADRLNPSASAPLVEGLQATLTRSRPVTIEYLERSVTLRTAAATVGDALTEARLAPQGLDYTLPSPESPIPASGFIRLVRVTEQVTIEQEPLPFGNEVQYVDNLELDQQKLLSAGEYGLKARRIRVRFEDGMEVARAIESEWVALEPKPAVTGYGTQIVQRTLDTPDGAITYYRALSFWVTSYAPKFVGGSTRTASGKTVRKGLVGVDRNYIPFGTMMYIPGYGYAEAADTGAYTGRWIDLGYTDEEYVSWARWVTVYFLWPPGSFVPPVIPAPNHY
jgi:uncharacterized protein YabE (DUF348 family)